MNVTNVLNFSHGFYEYDPSHGFEADMTPEEIFNMFFGGGKPALSVRSSKNVNNAD